MPQSGLFQKKNSVQQRSAWLSRWSQCSIISEKCKAVLCIMAALHESSPPCSGCAVVVVVVLLLVVALHIPAALGMLEEAPSPKGD